METYVPSKSIMTFLMLITCTLTRNKGGWVWWSQQLGNSDTPPNIASSSSDNKKVLLEYENIRDFLVSYFQPLTECYYLLLNLCSFFPLYGVYSHITELWQSHPFKVHFRNHVHKEIFLPVHPH